MAVSVIGDGSIAAAVRAAVHGTTHAWAWIGPGAPDYVLSQAAVALRHALPVQMVWPDGARAHDAEFLLRIADESGVDVAVAQPLMFDPEAARLVEAGPFGLLSIRCGSPQPFAAVCADVISLGSALAGHQSVRDAHIMRAPDGGTAVMVRFRGGSVMQLALTTRSDSTLDVWATSTSRGAAVHRSFSPRFGVDAGSSYSASALAFDQSVATGTSCPGQLADMIAVIKLCGPLSPEPLIER